MADNLSVFSQASLTLMASPSGPGRLASGEALLRVEFETERFNESLKEYVNVFRRDLEETIRVVSLELLSRIQRRTPVATGRLRNSFHAVMPGETDTYVYADNRGRTFWGALDEHSHAQDDNEVIEAVVGTNVPYALFIEAGHSRQAPNGMVAISRAEMASVFEAMIEKALEDRTS